jgi:hypothetical protein
MQNAKKCILFLYVFIETFKLRENWCNRRLKTPITPKKIRNLLVLQESLRLLRLFLRGEGAHYCETYRVEDLVHVIVQFDGESQGDGLLGLGQATDAKVGHDSSPNERSPHSAGF